MTDITRVCVVSTAEAALKKLQKAEIGVYDCKKDGTRFIFSVKDKQLKKVFAIFAKPCYNVTVVGASKRNRLLNTLFTRVGLILGAALFVIFAVVSNSFILKITVSGSGSYLSPEVRRILYETGVAEYRLYSGFDAPSATGKILALPRVTFCNIEKHGSVLIVDVQVDEEHGGAVYRDSLASDRSGIVRKVVAICGTAVVEEGDSVKKGDTLIAARALAGDKDVESIAVGYVELECSGSVEYFALTQSDDSLKAAYASVLLYADEILTRSYTVESSENGFVYVIDFTYLHKLSINME